MRAFRPRRRLSKWHDLAMGGEPKQHAEQYREHAPPAALAPYVTCFWEITGRVAPHRVLPDGAMDVIFAAGDLAARVIGPMTCARVTPPGDAAWVAGVRFRPGAAVEMLGIAARELLDDAAGARDVWGAAGRTLDARLVEARDASQARAAIEAELLARQSRARLPDARLGRAVATLRAARGELPIPAVATGAGLGERQLERLFVERVGYGPKLFARVVRLESAVAAILSSVRVRGSIASWASFARSCGYGDQAHLIREFRALTGVTPAVYAGERAMSEIDNTVRRAVATFGA
jgi:AraC-like DNA-binding protein